MYTENDLIITNASIMLTVKGEIQALVLDSGTFLLFDKSSDNSPDPNGSGFPDIEARVLNYTSEIKFKFNRNHLMKKMADEHGNWYLKIEGL